MTIKGLKRMYSFVKICIFSPLLVSVLVVWAEVYFFTGWD